MIFRRLALGFALFLVAVVLLADRGLVGPIFGWLYNFPYGDKVGHFALFGGLACLAALGFPLRRASVGSLRVLWSSLILAGIVTLEEISQTFFPTRTADLLDLTASLAGIFILGEAGAYLHNKRSAA